jgi:hypothetical protein
VDREIRRHRIIGCNGVGGGVDRPVIPAISRHGWLLVYEQFPRLFELQGHIDTRLIQSGCCQRITANRDFIDGIARIPDRVNAGTIRHRACRFNNAAERQTGLIALVRKNDLVAGSMEGGRRAAILYRLTATAEMIGWDHAAYLRELLTRMAGQTINRIEEITPWMKTQRNACLRKAKAPQSR